MYNSGVGKEEAYEFTVEVMIFGVGEYDALHVASAIVGKADVLVTTDDKLIKRVSQFGKIKAFFSG